jgi:hypothetical protein
MLPASRFIGLFFYEFGAFYFNWLLCQQNLLVLVKAMVRNVFFFFHDGFGHLLLT